MSDTATQSTVNWSVVKEFKTFPNFMGCQVVEDHTQYPNGATELEIEIWNTAVDAKEAQLKSEGLQTRVQDVLGRKGLKAKKPGDTGFRMAMYPGDQFRLAEYDADRQVLQVEKTLFSEIEALKSPEYRQLFENAGLPLPHGPIAPVLYIVTMDGYVAATVRGTGTNKYPGGIWGVGGDIDDPSLTVGEHQGDIVFLFGFC